MIKALFAKLFQREQGAEIRSEYGGYLTQVVVRERIATEDSELARRLRTTRPISVARERVALKTPHYPDIPELR